MNESGGEASKELVQERIYNNQHLAVLRNELESLEEEHESVLRDLKELRRE
ncbi:MAG TPA: hypothetical protein VKR31_09365 [Rhizomicrobium sp.]|nr:hypothetical protein [Rhizomicrobium sp.]